MSISYHAHETSPNNTSINSRKSRRITKKSKNDGKQFEIHGETSQKNQTLKDFLSVRECLEKQESNFKEMNNQFESIDTYDEGSNAWKSRRNDDTDSIQKEMRDINKLGLHTDTDISRNHDDKSLATTVS